MVRKNVHCDVFGTRGRKFNDAGIKGVYVLRVRLETPSKPQKVKQENDFQNRGPKSEIRIREIKTLLFFKAKSKLPEASCFA